MTDQLNGHPSTWEAEVRAIQSSIEHLQRRFDVAIQTMMEVDEYLTRLQTPGSEPLNSVNASRTKAERSQRTARVRSEAREYWSKLGNAIAEITENKNTRTMQ